MVDIDNFTDYFPPSTDMRALVLRKPGQADLETVADPVLRDGNVLLKVRFIGFCGSDLNSFRGLNPLVTYPRILGHEVSATVVEDLGREGALPAGTNVAVSPYTNCGQCSSCLRGRPTRTSERLPVQPDSRCAKGWRTHRNSL
jgi:threonine dehydrogenase-like Zn-dependent dehydrogenase